MPKAEQHKTKKKQRVWAWRGWDAPDKMLKARRLYVKQVKQQDKPTAQQKQQHDDDSAMDESD